MTLLISQGMSMIHMIHMICWDGVGDDRDGGRGSMADHSWVRLCQGEEGEGGEEEREEDLDRRGVRKG